MTQFAGYVLSGSVFIAFGLKWSLDATTDGPGDAYALDDTRSSSRGSRNSTKRRRSTCKLRHWPLQGLTKLGVASLGLSASLYSAYPQGEFKFVGDILYATIYLFFALSGLVDVLVFYCPMVMPFGLDKFVLSLSFVIEGLMFSLHRSHESYMEQHAHLLLVFAIFSCALATLLEVVMPWSRIVRFAKAHFTLIHGSWLIQSGFILYNPTQSSLTWSSNDDFNSALIWISLTFAWHCAGALVILLILMALSRKRTPLMPPQVEPFEAEHRSISQHRSVGSIPRCHFSSLSNYGDLKA